MNAAPIRYRITPARPEAHLFEVECTVADPDPQGQRFALPAWIPGSYLVRDFARHVLSARAGARGRAVPLEKIDKHTWRAAPVAGALTVTIEVYAWDLSVRAAHLDTTHGFFNGTSVFLRVIGREDRPCLVDIRPPAGKAYAHWQVASTLPPADGLRGAAGEWGFGLRRAQDYDALIDHPVEMGRFARVEFAVRGVAHALAITGSADFDGARLAKDLKRVCARHVALFGSKPPFARYLFLVTALGEGYGGLEHRDSTALICGRHELPAPGLGAPDEGYRNFLGLASHEYFHAWNVKRIKPAAFVPYRLDAENYTALLWAFEGFTAYYDDLALVRAGVISRADYLAQLAKTMEQVRHTPGRFRQSLAEASFDAWIKFYKPDENTPNATVSYYGQGALLAATLDLRLREATRGKASLDDVMRALWKGFGIGGAGLAEADIVAAVRALDAGTARWFARAIHARGDVAIEPALKAVGIDTAWSAASEAPTLAVKTRAEAGLLALAQVFEGGPAQRAGLAAGDLLVAVDGLRVTASNLDHLLARAGAGRAVALDVFRRDQLMRFEATPAPAAKERCTLAFADRGNALRKRLCEGWLGAA